MPAEPNLLDCVDYAEIEMRILAVMTDNGPERKRAANRRERLVNILMGDHCERTSTS